MSRPLLFSLMTEQLRRTQNEDGKQGNIERGQHMSLSADYCKERRPIIAASTAVLGTRASSRIDSWEACAPSPTAPIPSSVEIPRAEVKFPSEPPPAAASRHLKPSPAT